MVFILDYYVQKQKLAVEIHSNFIGSSKKEKGIAIERL